MGGMQRHADDAPRAGNKIRPSIDEDEMTTHMAQNRGHHPFHDARRSAAIRSILNASRKQRIAGGSGATSVQEINLLLKQFEQTCRR